VSRLGGDREEQPRSCRSCGALVPVERHQIEERITWIWRCSCGWANARTESGVVSRKKAREAIARALEKAGKT